MLPDRLPNYLKMHRKRAGLSQAELARLLGCRSAGKVSRYEHFKRVPTLETALACEQIFGVPVRELFAGLTDEIIRDTRKQARALQRYLAARHDQKVVGRKLQALLSITTPPLDDIRYEPLDDL